jgi:tetratricopeptide (TPR) repeat protein
MRFRTALSLRILTRAALLGAALTVAGCQTLGDLTGEEQTKKTNPVSEAQGLSQRGVEAMRANKFDEASVYLNAALKLDIQNSYLQFLNGLNYHLQGLRADKSKFPLAEEGYKLAIKFDATNWLARYYRGLLFLDQRQFTLARDAFADALLFNDKDPDLLYNFAVAAYYAQDPETAAGALEKLRNVEPDSPRVLRASTMGWVSSTRHAIF